MTVANNILKAAVVIAVLLASAVNSYEDTTFVSNTFNRVDVADDASSIFTTDNVNEQLLEEKDNSETSEEEEIEPSRAVLFPWFTEILGVLIFFLTTRYVLIIPYTGIMFILGIFCGAGATRLDLNDHLTQSLTQWSNINYEVLLLVFLPGLIFNDSFGLDVHLFGIAINQCIIYAFPMVLAGTALTALVGYYVLPYDWSFNLAMTFGSILSATDPVLPQIVTLAEIEEIVSSPKFATNLIEAIKQGFISYSNDEFNACPIQTMGALPMKAFGDNNNSNNSNYSAQTCVKSGYVSKASHFVIKVASGGHPFPNNSGNIQLYSQQTGKLETILMDEGILTEIRTAACGAVAAELLSPNLFTKDSVIGILGTGVQARYQLQYLKYITECCNVLVWGRTEKNVTQFIKDMKSKGWNIKAVDDPNKLLDLCSLIVTTTCSREPILGKGYNTQLLRKKPLHITAIGSDATGKVEVTNELISSANLLVADSRLQTKERGEFEDVISNELVKLDDIIEIGELANKHELQRRNDTDDDRLTIFDSSGVAIQDCIIAMMVNDALCKD